MRKYRKKPIVIEAVQFKKGLKHPALCKTYDHMNGNRSIGYGIKTLEGLMEVQEGDWIIKGVKGEFYPIKNYIFLQTYEKVDE